MPEENFDARFARHDAMIQALARVWHRQGELNEEQRAINAHLDAAIDELKGFNREQVAINTRLEVTQARIEQLLATLIERGANGRRA